MRKVRFVLVVFILLSFWSSSGFAQLRPRVQAREAARMDNQNQEQQNQGDGILNDYIKNGFVFRYVQIRPEAAVIWVYEKYRIKEYKFRLELCQRAAKGYGAPQVWLYKVEDGNLYGVFNTQENVLRGSW